MSILPIGYVKWDGTKYVIDSTVNLAGPAGPPGPQGPAGIAVGPASGDLGGNYPNPLVVKLQGRNVSSTAPTNGQLLTWVAGNNDWEPVSAPSGFTAGGDLSGTSTNQNVINIHGASVPIAGSLTTGNVLQVTGASALSYSAINLAGGSNFVTGTLPSGNQASQTMGGDVTGTTASNTVVTLTGSAGIVSLPTSTSIKLDTGSGTFPASGLIRSKQYAGVQTLWEGKNAGGDAIIIQQSTNSLNLGDSDATAGWFTNLNGYSTTLSARVGATYSSPTHTFADFSGTEKFRFTAADPSLKLDSGSGFTFPADGYIRVPDYSNGGGVHPGNRTIIGSRNAGGDSPILTFDPYNQFVSFGSDTVTVGTHTFIKGYYGVDISSVGISLRFAVPVATPSVIWQTQGNIQNMNWDFAAATGNCNLRFGNSIIPTIKQDDLTTNSGTGATLTIQAQNETGTTSIGGDLVLVAGTGTSTNGNIKANSPIQLDAASGTFPVAGLIRTKQETTLLWGGRNSAGDANIINQSNASLTFGDANATSGWTTNLFGYNTTIQCRTTLDVYVGAGANLGFYEFGGNKNVTWTFAAASGAASMAWADNIIPTIKQAQATSGNGATFTIAAQDGFGTGVTNGGTIKIFGGTPHSSGTSGGVWISSDSSLTHSSIYVTDSSVDIGNAGTGNLYLDTPLLHFRTAAGVSIIDSQLATASSYFEWTGAMTGDVTIDIAQNTAQNNGVNLILGAQPAKLSGSGNGGNLLLRGGARDGTGLKGGVKIQLNSTTETMFEAVAVVDGYRVTALNRGANLTSTQMPFDSGDLVTYIGNANIVPHVNPVSGVILYSDAGVAKIRQPDGTVVTIASSSNTISGDVTGTLSASVVSAISGSSPIAITPATLQWTSGTTTPTLNQASTSSTSGADLTIQAQGATGGSHNGGNLILSSGTSGSATVGSINFQLAGTTKMMLNTDGGLRLNRSTAITSTNVATNGDLNFSNTGIVYFRNASNSTDIQAITFDSSNRITLGYGNGFSSPANLQLEADSSKSIYIKTTPTLQFANNISSPTIKIEDATNGSGSDLTIKAQDGHNGGIANDNGGNVNIQGGLQIDGGGGTSKRGGVRLQLNATSETMFEAVEVAHGRRITAINRGTANITTTEMPTNTGDLVTFIGDTATAPTASAVSGGIMYSESGALKWRGSSGTTTTMGPAEPHCPVCGSDFVTEHQSDTYGYLSVCLKCLSDFLGAQPWIQRSR